MKTTKLITAAAVAMMAAAPAMAELFVPSLTYRSGPYAANGIPTADGYADYFTLLNERDGGIGGVKVNVEECETGYNTEKGVECYEAIKSKNPLTVHPWSTGITYQLIPKATADGIPVHSVGYGRTSAKNGEVFRWVFNYPANYWDGASVAISHIVDQEGEDLSGKKIALVYHNSAFGKEPIRTLEELGKKYGYELMLLPVDHPGQEQKSQWLQVRQQRPDYVIMWGWGVMNQVAIQEAVNIRYPMDHFIGIWWSGSENDVKPAGEGANGYKALTFNGLAKDYPIFDDLKQYVHDAGKGAGAGDQVGTVLYMRGLYSALMTAEAIKKAQEIHGTPDVTPAMVRDGYENLEITQATYEALGLPGFGPDIQGSCQNHGGQGLAAVSQWDAAAGQFTLVTDYIEADQEIIQPLIEEDSTAYAQEAGITAGCE